MSDKDQLTALFDDALRRVSTSTKHQAAIARGALSNAIMALAKCSCQCPCAMCSNQDCRESIEIATWVVEEIESGGV